MSGRVVAMSGRPTFDVIRERLGPRVGLVNLVGSMAVTLLTFTAEIGGVALAFELATSVWEFFWVPFVAILVWLVLWRGGGGPLQKNFLLFCFGVVGVLVVPSLPGPGGWGLGGPGPAAPRPQKEGGRRP